MPAYHVPQDTPTTSRSGQLPQDVDYSSSRSGSPRPASGRSSPIMVFNPYYTGRPRTPQSASKHTAVDRQEIIRRIKSRDDRSRPSSPELERQIPSRDGEMRTNNDAVSAAQQEELGLQIERPRSALHRGDFRDKGEADVSSGAIAEHDGALSVLSTSPPAPWHVDFPAAAFRQAWSERRTPHLRTQHLTTPRPARQRATSYNISQFVYKPPTSPLVNQSRPDTPPVHIARTSPSPEKQSRRHTFSPQAFQQFTHSLNESNSPAPTLRKEHTYPYQAHQPRRSLHSLQAFSSSPTSPSRHPVSARRPSASSEAHSPLQHAPMVGSYEESILRGRMSTTPSKPLDFIAQIGVLGRGDCKSSLKCPQHVAVPFPAVFYSYGNNERPSTITSDQPSPYVGLIDLEHGLPNPAQAEKRRQRLSDRLQASAIIDDQDDPSQDDVGFEFEKQHRLRKIQKTKKRSASPKTPPGGCYRIPQQGQIQIVIKNPNKTAVKLFLVPYDLSDMSPGQKTFIRQRSYSAGPIIDMPLSSRKNLGTDRPEASLSTSEDPNDRPVLRYLVHLHIACTGKGRFWLYKSIRVVFANRVPDGKEKLRNEIQLPEPRYSVYKPSREAVSSHPSSPSQGAMAASRLPHQFAAASLPSHDFTNHSTREPVFQLPFQASLLPTLESRPSSRHDSDAMDVDSNLTRSEPGDPLSPTTSERPMSPTSPLALQEPFAFERDHSRERQNGVGRSNGASLLSQRLRGLGV